MSEQADIRADLREYVLYLDDEELTEEIFEWILESQERSDAETAREFVMSKLYEFDAEWEMYHAPSLTRGEDGFPDACEGCKYHGSACPMLKDGTETEWRDRKLEEAETPAEERAVIQQQARDVGCQVAKERLQEYDGDHSEFLREGVKLLQKANRRLHDSPGDADGEGDGRAVDPSAVVEEELGGAAAAGGDD